MAASGSDAVPETQQFGNVLLAGKDQHRQENLGTLRVHAGGFGWKSRTTGDVIAVSKADLRGVEWAKAPPYACMLKLRLKGGFTHTFVGLRSQDKALLSDYVSKVFEVELEDVPFSWKGWNWGEVTVDGSAVTFKVENQPALQIPLNAISQATAPSRKEAIIELADDDTAEPEDEMIVGIRFHVPDVEGEEDNEEEMTPAEQLIAQIKESGDLETSGTAIAGFEDVGITVPRGRYDLEFFDKHFKMHGKTYDYKVLYSNVSSVYVLPKQDNYTVAFAISLEHPLRQGATMYPHIIMQLPREAVVEVNVNLPDAERERRFDDKLDKQESGDLVDVLPKVMCAFTKRKVIRPKATGFNGEKEDKFKSIRCSLKANDGYLYPLDKSFFFIANKPVQLDFERIGSLEFNRVDKGTTAQAARTFDITIHMRDGTNHQFVNLQRSDYKELFNFLTNKNIKIRNLAAANKNAEEADEESGEEGDDPYMDRLKRQRAAAQATEMDLGDDEDDDDSEEDEDFAPAEVSDVEEEYEEGAEVVDGEPAGKTKKKVAKADAASPANSSDGSGSGSDSEAPKLPPKKKAKAEVSKGKKSAEADKGRKPARKKKDKDAPKRGMSGYMFFMNANRERYKQEHPGAKVTEIGKFAGEEWRTMDAEAKAPWEEKAKADKERYEREMKEYTEAKRAALAEATSSEDEGDVGGPGGSSDED